MDIAPGFAHRARIAGTVIGIVLIIWAGFTILGCYVRPDESLPVNIYYGGLATLDLTAIAVFIGAVCIGVILLLRWLIKGSPNIPLHHKRTKHPR